MAKKIELKFKASTIISGWKVGLKGIEKILYVCKVRYFGVEINSKSYRCTRFVSESGGSHAEQYLDRCYLKVHNSSELLQHVTRALLYATFFYECNSRYVSVFEVLKQEGFEKLYIPG